MKNNNPKQMNKIAQYSSKQLHKLLIKRLKFKKILKNTSHTDDCGGGTGF
jgi:hypothetical protein